ncbi:MAG: hypothetical protein RIG61_04245 [Deltaproteobacteria bacterium]
MIDSTTNTVLHIYGGLLKAGKLKILTLEERKADCEEIEKKSEEIHEYIRKMKDKHPGPK